MNRIISNLLSGASGLLVLIPAQSIPQLRPVTTERSDVEALRGDAEKIGMDFNAAISKIINGKPPKKAA
ncbi:MAG: hypothetical protein PSX71_00395 [bacterium]|nr:hypothetical protein [bacterium]